MKNIENSLYFNDRLYGKEGKFYIDFSVKLNTESHEVEYGEDCKRFLDKVKSGIINKDDYVSISCYYDYSAFYSLIRNLLGFCNSNCCMELKTYSMPKYLKIEDLDVMYDYEKVYKCLLDSNMLNEDEVSTSLKEAILSYK